jgi:UDP-N-acetylglucosamine 1-carboxyvinyltransferase
MDRLRIRGGVPLEGEVVAAGAKNAALPILAASLLTDEPLLLRRVPRLNDVETMLRLLQYLGCEHEWREDGALRVRLAGEESSTAPYDLVKTMRASVLVLGPLVARRETARVSLPGGCAIGARPVDLHLQALGELGAEISLVHGYVEASRGGRLHGAFLDFPSVTVTGTENALMAAVLAEGETEIRNAAREPEVVALAEALRAMGARIEGAGTSVLRIEGMERLHGAEISIVPDRIEAGTYLVAGAITGGAVTVRGCVPDHMDALLGTLASCGAGVERGPDSVHVWRAGPLRAEDVATAPYPGFPTDLQAQFLALMTQAEGTSTVTETIFENRFQHVLELQRMGARVEISGSAARVHGPTPLQGAEVMSTDLRASACLVLAGLVAEGETMVHRIYHLDRGYEDLEGKLRSLGGRVVRIR